LDTPKEATEVLTIIVFPNSKTMDKSKDASKEWFDHAYVKHFFLLLSFHEYGFSTVVL
jgi:hypothetical protein